MKRIIMLILVIFSVSASAEQANLISIDDHYAPLKSTTVSEEGLPQDHYYDLLERLDSFRFNFLSEAKARSIFNSLKSNPRARMRQPAGACSTRRAYIQSKLKAMGLVTGKLYLYCPSKTGRLRLRDRVSGRYYTYSNFHDTNIVAVETNNDIEFRVMDVQFEDRPVSLHAYLTEVENSQRIRPEKNKEDESKAGICYWYISTPYLRFKN